MKFIGLSILLLIIEPNLILGASSLLQSDNGFSTDAVIHQLFEELRYVIKNGYSANNIPVLDPFEFDIKKFKFPGEYLSLKVNVSNGDFSGLGDFQILPFTFEPNEVSIMLNIKFPLLLLKSEHYDMQGDINEAVPLAGQGKLHFEVHDLIVSGKVYLKQSEDSKSALLFNITNANYVMDRIMSRSDFDGNIDDILNSMIEQVLGGYLNRFSKYIATTYSNILVHYINNLLQNFDTWNMIAIISNL